MANLSESSLDELRLAYRPDKIRAPARSLPPDTGLRPTPVPAAMGAGCLWGGDDGRVGVRQSPNRQLLARLAQPRNAVRSDYDPDKPHPTV